MNRRPLVPALLALGLAASCSPAAAPHGVASAPRTSATASAPPAPAGAKSPETPRRPVVDDYFGTKVTDDYRWLEDWNDPAVKRWSAEENTYARAHLDAIPMRAAIKERVRALLADPSPTWSDLRWQGGEIFALEDAPPKQQPMLVVMTRPDPATQRVIVDPNAMDASGSTTIDFFVPSHDGKKVAVSLSKGGTEDGTVHVFDVATGKETGDVLPRVNGGTAGGSLAWNADGSGFFYTRYPHEGERPPVDLDFYQQVFFHRLGAPVDQDAYAVGKDFPRIAEVHLRSSDDGKYALALVENGDGGEFALWVLGPSKTWSKVADFADAVVSAHFGPDDGLFVLSRKAAPRGRVLRLDAQRPDLARATVVVDQSDVVIDGFAVAKTKLYTIDTVGGPSQVRAFALAGKRAPEVLPTPPVSWAREVLPLAGDEALVDVESFTTPEIWLRTTPDKKLEPTPIAHASKIDFSDVEVARTTCTSADGTKVPMTVLHKKGIALDGSAPALLRGYGGFDISERPRLRPELRLWLDAGGVWADANTRGGGEYGEDWHRAGNLTHKQNVFDDFYACARELVTEKYTRPERLAIQGGSNGGLLMGAELTQHPEAFRAVVSHVGYYDMLRFETAPNGVFNVTEYGSVKDEAQCKALLAYSPYQHVVDGTKYPAVLMLTGANDPRVAPFHSRKMIARLQAATASGLPVLLRTSSTTGHGIGTPLDEDVEQKTDVYAFLFEQLGVAMP